MLKLFDLLEVYSSLNKGCKVRRIDWDDNRYIFIIGKTIVYSSPMFTTEYKFGLDDFAATWELVEEQ